MIRTILPVFMLALAAAPAAAGEAVDNRTVSASGQARILTAPDMAILRMGVQARQPTVEEARDEVAGVVERFLALALEMGIPENRVATASSQVNPDYQWNPQSRERKLLGYVVTRHITVDLAMAEHPGSLGRPRREVARLGPRPEPGHGTGPGQEHPVPWPGRAHADSAA